jgi:uncharacterized protein
MLYLGRVPRHKEVIKIRTFPMVMSRFVHVIAFAWILALVCMPTNPIHAQETAAADAIAHAKRIVDALEHEKFEDVAKEFNAQVTAALSVEQLRATWSAFHEQVGAFRSFFEQRASTPRPGITAVVLACHFEKTDINIVVAFDGDNKIGGLRFMPHPAPSDANAARPTSTKFSEESVTVGTGDWALPGTLSMPVGRIIAAVVLVHGSGPHDRDETIGPNKPFRDIAWGLADRGIAVLRYEKRTRQHPARSSNITNLTVREEVIDDAIAAVALLRAHDRIDPKRVFVLGHSLGGTLAPRIAASAAAAAADQPVAGLIIMAGATRPLLDIAREQLTYLASLKPKTAGTPNNPNAGDANLDKSVEALRAQAPESYWKDLDAYNPVQTAARLTIPMLILQGERDYQVTMQDLEGWRNGLRERAKVTIKSYPTLNHLFQPGEGKSTPAEYDRAGHIPDFVLDDIAAWLSKL